MPDTCEPASMIASKLIFVPLATSCARRPPCAGCSRMQGFYRLVWHIAPQDFDPQTLSRLYRHRLFGEVICAN